MEIVITLLIFVGFHFAIPIWKENGKLKFSPHNFSIFWIFSVFLTIFGLKKAKNRSCHNFACFCWISLCPTNLERKWKVKILSKLNFSIFCIFSTFLTIFWLKKAKMEVVITLLVFVGFWFVNPYSTLDVSGCLGA